MPTAVAPKGLEGIVATSSSICWIDGDAGVLSYRGIDIHELAQRSTFEETTYLLWFGKLPNAAELADFTKQLAERVPDGHVVGLDAQRTMLDEARRVALANQSFIEGPVQRDGGRALGTGIGTSLYTRDPDGNLLEFMVY